ncbi:hypothetical protein J437_LFUL002794 [Ladona fulva]|uniref:ZZ-type zinc finger-containing protein 3 n=1 Tax=Ladona fulva TaxID=123851 RepID=A0A8K0P1Y9_LADFU|nr:hypothetical protein J437_LFUL002794 [Ladona fulva]
MEGTSDGADYKFLSDEEFETKEKNLDSNNDDDDPGVLYFESDQLALKGNKDYHEILRVIVILEAQREYAVKAIEKLIELRKEAEENPEAIVARLAAGESLGVPEEQTLPKLPDIDWSRYNLPPPPDISQIQNKAVYEGESSTNANARGESKGEPPEKRSKVLVRGREFNDSKPETFNQLWTSEEQRRLEELLIEYPPEEVETRRWRKIADALGNRTAKQVQSRVQKYFIKLHKAGLPIPGRCPRLQGESQLRKSLHKHQRNNHFLFRPSTFFPSHDVPMNISDSEDESSIPRRVYLTKEDSVSDKEDQDENTDEGSSVTVPEEVKNSEEYRKLDLLKRIRKELDRASGSKFEHIGYRCDNCKEEPIKGPRWHCDECTAAGESVDFCTDCIVSMMDNTQSPFASVNHKPQDTSKNPHPLKHFMRPIRGRTGKTTTGVWDPDYFPESFYGGYNYLDPNFMPE